MPQRLFDRTRRLMTDDEHRRAERFDMVILALILLGSVVACFLVR